MKERLKNYFDTKTIIWGCLLFFAFAALVYLFPYSGDDWAWGSEIGISRLQTFFDNYNGRYAGNILVMLLTRSNLLRIVTISGSLLILCFISKFYCESKSNISLSLAALLILLTPKQIFVQSITWTAGFSNYIPPILIIAIYFLSVKNVFEESKPQYSRFLPLLTFACGFISSLFMENVTLYGLFVAVIILFTSIIKHRKIYASHVANLIGCVLGTIVMFSNSVYSSIANSNDGYRSTAFDGGLFATINDHFKIIIDQFFIKNLPLLFIVTILMAILAFKKMKTTDNKSDLALITASVVINIFCLVLLYAKKEFSYWRILLENKKSADFTELFILCVAFIYMFTVLELVFLCITDKSKMLKAEFLLISIPVLIGPLLVVNPIGPRCFFPPYFVMIVFCAYILEQITESFKADKTVTLSINTITLASAASVFVFLFCIYSTIHTYDTKRNEYALKQQDAGYETITICELPYASYVWTGNPDAEPWSTRYKLFHNIDKEKKLMLLPYNEFNDWAAEFDKEVNS